MTMKVSASEKIRTSFQKLAASAANLNQVSDELSKPIEDLGEALKKLNLGVTAWVTFAEDDDTKYGRGSWWARNIGYAKISGKWGIALRTVSGDYSYPDDERDEAWLFNDAPRWLRLEGIDHLPELIDKLIEETEATSQKLKEKIDAATALAGAIDGLSPAKKK